MGAGAAALLTFSLLSHGRGVSDLMARRVLAAPSTLALCHGTVLAPPTLNFTPTENLSAFEATGSLTFWVKTDNYPGKIQIGISTNRTATAW